MIAYLVLLTVLFSVPLTRLVVHAIGSDLHSHIPIVPLIVTYVLYERRSSLPRPGRPSLSSGALLGSLGVVLLVSAALFSDRVSENDRLAVVAAAYVSLLAAGGFVLGGKHWMRAVAFPAAFLIFLLPLPDAAVYWLERGSVVASAEAAAVYFWLADTPLVRHGTLFELPGISLQVAQECSGIRSSWVLFITSVLASNMFLKSPWRRLMLVVFVVPLGILRNGFRVFVLGMLCVHVGPHMIETRIHHQGGPLFFALSLGPLFFVLWWLRRGECRGAPAATTTAQSELPA